MKKWAVIFNLIFLTSLRGFDIDEDLDRLNREVILLNLINGLYLSGEQTRSLIDISRQAGTVRQDFRDYIATVKSDYMSLLESIRDILVRGEEIPPDLKKRVHEIKKEWHLREDRQGTLLSQLEQKAEALLTENQRIVLKDYQPCTIPPQTGNIGQSVEGRAEGIVRAFRGIRRAPEYRAEEAIQYFIGEFADRICRYQGFKSMESQKAYRMQCETIFRKVRSMGEKQYLLEKGELARSLLPEPANHKMIRKNQLGKTGRFLLDPALPSLLSMHDAGNFP